MKKNNNKWKYIIMIILLLLLMQSCDKINLSSLLSSEYSSRNSIVNKDRLLDMIGKETYDEECIAEHEVEMDIMYYECVIAGEGELSDCYRACEAEAELMMTIPSGIEEYITIIPAVAAIGPDLPFDDPGCYMDCDIDFGGGDEYYYCIEELERELITWGCINITEETATWDGRNVYDIGTFYETKFPESTESLKNYCLTWFGTWTSTPEMIGCTEFTYIIFSACEEESVISAGRVCETIHHEYTCNEDIIKCTE